MQLCHMRSQFSDPHWIAIILASYICYDHHDWKFGTNNLWDVVLGPPYFAIPNLPHLNGTIIRNCFHFFIILVTTKQDFFFFNLYIYKTKNPAENSWSNHSFKIIIYSCHVNQYSKTNLKLKKLFEIHSCIFSFETKLISSAFLQFDDVHCCRDFKIIATRKAQETQKAAHFSPRSDAPNPFNRPPNP